jgi:hypothetical protein
MLGLYFPIKNDENIRNHEFEYHSNSTNDKDIRNENFQISLMLGHECMFSSTIINAIKVAVWTVKASFTTNTMIHQFDCLEIFICN